MEHTSNIGIEASTEYTRKRFAEMSDNEKAEMAILCTRHYRNELLKESDNWMNQQDRFNTQQFDMIKRYRQELRDVMNNNINQIRMGTRVEMPKKPDFL